MCYYISEVLDAGLLGPLFKVRFIVVCFRFHNFSKICILWQVYFIIYYGFDVMVKAFAYFGYPLPQMSYGAVENFVILLFEFDKWKKGVCLDPFINTLACFWTLFLFFFCYFCGQLVRESNIVISANCEENLFLCHLCLSGLYSDYVL